MGAMAHVSVVVPVYDESAVLPELYRRLKAALASLGPEHSHGILFVDDGSTDASPAWVAGLARRDAAVRVLTLSRNFGHQVAITAGLDAAPGDAVVVMDADLQDSAGGHPGHGGAVVVRRPRRLRRAAAPRRRAGSAFGVLSRLLPPVGLDFSDTPLPADSGDFRLLDRRVVEVLLRFCEQDRYVRGLVAWAGFRQEPLYYDRDARFAGCPKYTWGARAKLALDAATSFSSRPLTLLASVGAACRAAATAVAAGARGAPACRCRRRCSWAPCSWAALSWWPWGCLASTSVASCERANDARCTWSRTPAPATRRPRRPWPSDEKVAL